MGDEQKDYKIISLKFVVYNNGNIAVLDKKEEDLVDIQDGEAVMVYEKGARIDGAIPKAIEKLSGTPVVAEEKDADNTGAVPETNLEEGAENKDVANENTGAAPGTNLEEGAENNEGGGSRKAQPKNVSFSRKYPKNKSNKKTLRNLERIVSH